MTANSSASKLFYSSEVGDELGYKISNRDSKIDPSEQIPPHVSIRIADNGPGIPPTILERIFESFFTTKSSEKGTGLGLSISHQIITEKHRGQINVTSKGGRGTEFEILLPVL